MKDFDFSVDIINIFVLFRNETKLKHLFVMAPMHSSDLICYLLASAYNFPLFH